MADDPVTKIYGIGPVTASALHQHKILTVQQLAALEPGELSIAKLETLIHRAKEYLKCHNANVSASSAAEAAPAVLVLSGATAATTTEAAQPPVASASVPPPKNLFAPKIIKGPVAKATAAAPVKAASAAAEPPSEELTKEQFMIADHTWFETRVVVPSEDALREAIVYELCVEPNERVAFVCIWVTSEPTPPSAGDPKRVADHLHTMTYSPQLLLHFNMDLPPLRVSMRENDFQALPNQHTLTNALWEVDMMQRRLHV